VTKIGCVKKKIKKAKGAIDKLHFTLMKYAACVKFVEKKRAFL
jgi:hypothetical protein